MAYEHVTKLPFLLDASHLTPEEVAERDANPTLFAARRYGQPEHIFQAAAEHHGKSLVKVAHPTFLAAYSQASLPFDPPRTMALEAVSPVSLPQSPPKMQSPPSPLVQTHLVPSPSAISGPSNPTPYLSTVLSPETTSEKAYNSPTPSSPRETNLDQPHHGAPQSSHPEELRRTNEVSISSKKESTIRE